MAAASEHLEGSLQEEFELLEAIYVHELTLEGPKEKPTSVSLLLHPSTGDEGEKQYVCLTLQVLLPNEYPHVLPAIHIKNPRGLSDAHVESIISNLRELAESRLGSPMLYELIEYAKESLTDNNIPSCACAICLSHFQDSHCFTKTECYHYFHCSCLASYIEYSLKKEQETNSDTSNESDQEDKQIVCPMCRLAITYDLDALKAAPKDDLLDDKVSYCPDKKMKELQKEMAKLFNKQSRKGGIINIEEERNKYLIEIKKNPESQTGTESSSEGVHPVLDLNIDSGNSSSANVLVDSKSTNYPAKGKEERQRELPSSSRSNRGRSGQQYRNVGRKNERSEEPRNDRPRSTNERGFRKGQRGDRGGYRTEHGRSEKYKGGQSNQTKKTFVKGAEGNKEVLTAEGEIKQQNLNKNIVKDENFEIKCSTAETNGQLRSTVNCSSVVSAAVGPQNEGSRETKSMLMQKDDFQSGKRTGSGYREDFKDKATRRAGTKEREFGDRNDSVGRGKKQINYNNDKTTNAKIGRRSPPTNETYSAASGKDSSDKRRRRRGGTKKLDEKDGDENIPRLNERGTLSSRSDKVKIQPVKSHSKELFACVENKKPMPSNSKMESKYTESIIRPPPGFNNIASNSGRSIGPPPGFDTKDSARKPPPGL